MKITKRQLKRIIKEELQKEGQHDMYMIKSFFEHLEDADDADFMGPVMRGDLARFIKRVPGPNTTGPMSREEAKGEADRLWPMALDYFEEEVKRNYSFGVPFDLEP